MPTAEINGEVQDRTMPEGRWAFDEDVTDAFDNMLARSIPQYDVMRRACFDLGAKYVTPGTDIVDLGCSRGQALAPFIEKFGAYNRFVGCEVSEPMLAASRARFDGYIRSGLCRVLNTDLREKYPPVNASLTLSVLTLQFVPIEYRQRVLSDVYEHTAPGGAFLLVEKVLGNSAKIDAALVETYYALKAENGYSQEAIERKRHALEGVLVPVTAHWNEELLRSAGFRFIDCFWRWMNFAGWIALK